MGNAWSCLTCSSSENENDNAMDVSPLLEIRDMSQIDDLISLIDKRLDATVIAMKTAQQGSSSTVSVQETATSSGLSPFIKFGKDLLEKVLKSVHGHGGKKQLISKVDRVTRKVVSDVTKELAKGSLLAAGLSVVAYVLDQIEQVSSNMNQCVQLLVYMCALAKRVKQLNEHLPEEKEKLNEAIKIIVKGSIMCVGHMTSRYLSRFFSASVEVADLQNIESQIQNLYPDLTLGAIICIMERMPVVLPPSQGEDPKAVGTVKQQDKVIDLLNMDINDKSRRAVVIYGVGGIGKTTLATAVFSRLKLEGYKFCRLDMEEFFSNDHLKQLQEQTLLDLFDQNIKLRSHVEGRDQVRKAFRGATHPVFMFIDNALKRNDLENLLPVDELSSFPMNTRILVTTRNVAETDMFKDTNEIQRYEHGVDFLSAEQAKKLLCNKALRGVNANFHESVDIDGLVNICGGIPLVLEIVGSRLGKWVRDVSECKEFVESLKKKLMEGEKEMTERVVDVVYNSLDEDCKEAFLDIACFFHNKPRRIAGYVVGKVRLRTLEDAALVKVFPQDKVYKKYNSLDGFVDYVDRKEGILKVQDVVRARGIRLSQSDRIIDNKSLKDALGDSQKLHKIKAICAPFYESTNISMEAKHLDMMNSSLRILEAKGKIRIDGRCTQSFDNLRYVDLLSHLHEVLPMDPNKLKQVSILCSNIEENVSE
ncbi:hypothetical protein KI387_033816, partial [Taxus chinensis]